MTPTARATANSDVASIVSRLNARPDAPAVWDRGEVSAGTLVQAVAAWRRRFKRHAIGKGTVVAVLADYSTESYAALLALFLERSIVVPFTPQMKTEMSALMPIAATEFLLSVGPESRWRIEPTSVANRNALVDSFRARESPGLVVFTSGSTGQPKGVLHDVELLVRKFLIPRDPWRTILFLSMDHLGGINTLLACLANSGVAICLPSRSPETVARTIESSRADLLPTTPTFLNLLAASGAYRAFDLSSVRMITYGTEAIADATLERTRMMFPNADIKQTYGLSELGVLRSKSMDSRSPWVQLGGAGFEVKVIDQVLWIRSESNMVGYLNAPSPFDGEGWMNTGDQVEVDGEWIRILGRRSEMINVGGQKVSPVEVESVLLQAPNVAEAVVRGQPHPLMGKVVSARVSLIEPEDPEEAVARLRRHCVERMPRYKVPVRIQIVQPEQQVNSRFKKVRRLSDEKS